MCPSHVLLQRFAAAAPGPAQQHNDVALLHVTLCVVPGNHMCPTVQYPHGTCEPHWAACGSKHMSDIPSVDDIRI